MQGASPIKSQTVLSLQNLQIDPKFFKFGVTNFESDKYISIKDPVVTEDSQIIIVELLNNQQCSKKPNKSDGALMHPTENIIALKAKNSNGTGQMLQIYNVPQKLKIKDISFNENIIYWRWVNTTKLGIITQTSVYHVNIANQNEQQVKILDRSGQLAEANVQIIGYNLDSSEKWCSLFGISTPDGGKTILGHIQLYLIEGAKQQLLEGHCCTFGEAMVQSDNYMSNLFCFFERKVADGIPKIKISEIGAPAPGQQKFKRDADFPVDPEFPTDFPVVMHISKKFGVLYVVTKSGFLYLYELSTASLLYRNRISDAAVFVGAKDSIQDGLYVISRSGNVILNRVDDANLINFIINNCKHIPDNVNLAFRLASKYQLPGAENMFFDQFNRLMVAGDIKGAAQIAANAPGTSIRNAETIAKLKQIPQQAGQPQPVLIYFQTILEKSQLNKIEAVELCGPVLAQGKKAFVEGWLKDNKLECSEQLGDLVKPFDMNMAQDIYKKVNAHAKVVQCLIEAGNTAAAMQYQAQTGTTVDHLSMIKSALATNPESALNIAKNFCKQNPNIPVHNIAELFLNFNRPQEMTGFLVECMKQNRPEDGPWQTKVLEFNLMTAPQVADTILQLDQWNQFNRPKIASICEQKGLFQRALENYNDIKDIKRVILNTHAINPEWLVNFIGKLQQDWCLACMQELIRHNRNNLQLVVNVAQQQSARLTIQACIKIFESVGAFDGIYLFLGAIINTTDDKDIHYTYIEAATKCNQLRVVESIIKDKTDCYDPERVKNFLKEMKLPDPKPLIFLCDIHGFVDELTKYLYSHNFNKYIEIYLFKVNPNATPQVLGTLIDLECDENYIKQILYTLRGNCPIEPLIEEFDKRNKVRIIENWLDSRIAEGNQIPAVHNALAKIKIDTNQDPENYLLHNQFYDPKVIGKFCEERDPHLAVIAYKRTWGSCDQELIMVTNKNALFRLQARYLVERQSKELWASVLSPDNPFRRQVIDQVVTAALPESKNVEEVSTTVQAFMQADLPNELIALLEKIVLHNSEFGQYKKLQNLLIITAIKADKTRVMDYINRLDNYDGPEIAKIALGEKYNLYEEAFVIYKKNNNHVEAIEVLLNNIEDIQRAAEYADKVNTPDVWSKLGHAYLNQYQVADAIECYIKAKDHSTFVTVISAAENEGKFQNLIKYILMVREFNKNVDIDNSLAYAYAKIEKNSELEAFISGANSVDAQKVGDRCFDDKLFESAKILFISIKNNAKIASCLVRLKQFQQAIDAAKKANSPKTWKELCMACVEAHEFKLAAVAGMNIIVHPDHLEDLIKHYEEYGFPDEMISLLEGGLGLERAHVGIYTELGVLYAKYQQNRLMEHCKQYFAKLNVAKLLRVCERFLCWKEAVYLYSNYDEFDNAVAIMIEHSPTAWQHDTFVNLIIKVANHDLYYKSILFYLEEQPTMVNDLLKALAPKMDLSKFVSVMKKTGFLALCTPFLKSVQNANNKEVNEALNEIFMEMEDYDALRQSITQYENLDQLALAKQTEKHELLEFRRIAAYLYRRLGKYEFSIDLSKQDGEFRDCVETALESGKPEQVENLLRFFVAKNEKEFFTVCLYTCYELIRPDVAMELSWRFGLMEHAMPFFIQITRELTARVETVQKKHDEREKKEEKQAQDKLNRPLDTIMNDMFMPGMATMMLPPPDMSLYPNAPGFNTGVPPQMGASGFNTTFPPQGPGMGGFQTYQQY